MRVMVTGHLGYIGTVMVPMLLRSGHEVIGLDSNLYESCTFEAGGNIAPVPHIRKDVRDVAAGHGSVNFCATPQPCLTPAARRMVSIISEAQYHG